MDQSNISFGNNSGNDEDVCISCNRQQQNDNSVINEQFICACARKRDYGGFMGCFRLCEAKKITLGERIKINDYILKEYKEGINVPNCTKQCNNIKHAHNYIDLCNYCSEAYCNEPLNIRPSIDQNVATNSYACHVCGFFDDDHRMCFFSWDKNSNNCISQVNECCECVQVDELRCSGSSNCTPNFFCCCRNRNSRKPWRKILYERQDYPDSYVDASFLSCLMRNSNLQRYIYSDLCKSTSVVTQHLSGILIVLLLYGMMLQRQIDPISLISFDLISLPIGYSMRWLLRPPSQEALPGLKSAFVVFGILRILTPVLRTLTQAFSDDTVIRLVFICLLLHITCCDYSYIYRTPGKLDAPVGRLLSVNSAIFSIVLLASRLQSSTEVFAFLFFGIKMFALCPVARRYLWNWSPKAFTFLATPLFVLVTAILLFYSKASSLLTAAYLLLMFFITFVAPYWLISLQKFKNALKGPWDLPLVPNYAEANACYAVQLLQRKLLHEQRILKEKLTKGAN